MVMTRQRLSELESGVFVCPDEAIDHAKVGHGHEIPIRAALCQPWHRLEDLGDRQRSTRLLEGLDDRPTLPRVALIRAGETEPDRLME